MNRWFSGILGFANIVTGLLVMEQWFSQNGFGLSGMYIFFFQMFASGIILINQAFKE